MRERMRRMLAGLGEVRTPEMTPVTWTVLLFMSAMLGDGVRARAARSPIPAGDANLIAIGIMVAFVALVMIVASIVVTLRDRPRS